MISEDGIKWIEMQKSWTINIRSGTVEGSRSHSPLKDKKIIFPRIAIDYPNI